MKIAITAVFILHFLISPTPADDNELTFLSSKIEVYLQEKHWQLVDKLVRDKVVYQQWRNVDHYIKLSFYYCKNEDEATKRLQDDMRGIKAEFGPGRKVQAIGDEAYEWEGLKDSQALVNFKKGRVIVAVMGPSIAVAEDCAKRIADLLTTATVAKAAA